MFWKSGLATRWGRAQIVIAVFVAVFSFCYLAVYLPHIFGLDGFGRTDFSIYYVGGSTVVTGLGHGVEDLYEGKVLKPVLRTLQGSYGPARFLYAPPAAVLFAPLHLIPFNFAYRAWIACNAILFIAGFYVLLVKVLKKPDAYHWRYSLLLLVLTFAYTILKLHKTGQINGLVLFGIIVLIWAVNKKRQVLSAGVITLLTIVKIYPLIFIPYVLWKRQWRAGALTGLFGASVFISTLPLLGWGTYEAFFHKAVPYFSSASLASSGNYAVYALLEGHWLYWAVFCAVIGLTGYCLWRFRHEQGSIHRLIDISLIVATILLVGKGVHAQYFLWLLPFIVFIITLDPTKQARIIVIIGFLGLILTQFMQLLPHESSILPIAGLLILYICMVIARFPRFRPYFGLSPEIQGKTP